MKELLVSIIILNWNGKKWLGKCLESIKNQGIFNKCQVILIDNNSHNDSVGYVKENFQWVDVIQNKENLGYAKANNIASEYARGRYLFFLNCDTWIDKNCLEELSKRAEERDGIFAPKQMSYDGKIFLSCMLGCDIFGYPIQGSHKLFYADGAALFIRKDLFRELGMFDEKTFFSFEDIDLSWRVLLQGYDIIPVQDAVVYHVSGGLLTGGLIKGKSYTTTIWRRYLGERNNLRNILKNYSLFTLVWVLPLYLCINLAEIILFLLIGRLKVVKDSYLKAWKYNIINFPETWKQHREIQRKRKVNDWEIFKKMECKIGKLEVFKKIGIPKFK